MQNNNDYIESKKMRRIRENGNEQMNASHKIVVKYLQTIHFYKAESAMKINALFNIQDVSNLMLFGVEKLILGKKVEKLLDTHILLKSIYL